MDLLQWMFLMIRAKLFRNKKTLVLLAIIVFGIALLVYFAVQYQSTHSSDKPDQNATESSQSDAPEEGIPVPELRSETPPPLPDECEYEENVKRLLGEDFQESGFSGRDEASSADVVDCMYRNDSINVSIRVYKYATEQAANESLQKINIQGYLVQAKSDHVIQVVISDRDNKVFKEEMDQLMNEVAQKL